MNMNRKPFRPSPAALLRAHCNQEFAGRYFAVGNPYTNAVWGKVGTFNQANDELFQDESTGNAGNGCNIIEVNADGVPIKPPMNG